jgi:hypothetical protein
MTLSNYGTAGTTPIGAAIVGWLTAIASVRVAVAAGTGSLFLTAGAMAVMLIRKREQSVTA